MHDHLIFGGCLRSAIAFPELAAATGQPQWTLIAPAASSTMSEIGASLPANEEATPLGEDVVYGECRVRSYRYSDRFRLVFDDTGTFDVARDGARLVWHGSAGRGGGASPEMFEEAVRADV